MLDISVQVTLRSAMESGGLLQSFFRLVFHLGSEECNSNIKRVANNSFSKSPIKICGQYCGLFQEK